MPGSEMEGGTVPMPECVRGRDLPPPMKNLEARAEGLMGETLTRPPTKQELGCTALVRVQGVTIRGFPLWVELEGEAAKDPKFEEKRVREILEELVRRHYENVEERRG